MSNKAAVAKFVNEILQHFPPYRWDDEQEQVWIDRVTLEISGFSAEVIDKALAEMVQKRGLTKDERRTPTVAECIRACVETRRWLEKETRKGELPINKDGDPYDWTPERLKLADDLIMGSEGRQAAREGWIGTLHAFARKNGRLPSGSEIGDCKRQAKEFDAAYALCVRGGESQGMSMQQMAPMRLLEQLGAKMLKKREELADRVLHGVVK